jgi:hypothetical protein
MTFQLSERFPLSIGVEEHDRDKPMVQEHCDTLHWFANEMPKSFVIFSETQKLVLQHLEERHDVSHSWTGLIPSPIATACKKLRSAHPFLLAYLSRFMLGLRWELHISKDRAKFLNADEAADLADLM